MAKPLLFGDASPVEKISKSDRRFKYMHPDRIGGYSEQVQANDIEKAQVPVDGIQGGLTQQQKEAYYQRFGTEPKELPVQFKWLRVSDAAGNNSGSADVEMMYARNDGWELITVKTPEEFKERFGYDFPDTGRIRPDGTIRRMDVALAYVDGDRAREIEAEAKADRKQQLEWERGGGLINQSVVAGETVAFESEGVISEQKAAVKTQPIL